MDTGTIQSVLKKIGRAADAYGFTCYAVGGYVRDRLMERPTKDVDVLVLEPEGGIGLAEILHEKYGFGRPVVFPRFQTAQTRCKGVAVELVAARSETYKSRSRKPAVGTATLKEDISRRDFTVNSLVMGLNKKNFGTVCDHTKKGKADIDKGIIRCIGKAEERFAEDPLRMLRAIRFACQLGFTIDAGVIKAIRKKRKRLQIISAERVRDELEKILLSTDPASGIRLLQETKLLELIDPELAKMDGFEQDSVYHGQDLFEHTLTVLSRAKKKLTVRLAVLYHDCGKMYTKRKKEDRYVYYNHERKSMDIAGRSLRNLKFSNKVIDDVKGLIGLHMINYSDEWSDAAIRRLIHRAGKHLADLLNIRRADMRALAPPYNNSKEIRELEARIKEVNISKIQRTRSPLNGDEIQEILGLGPGRHIARIKEKLLQAVLEGTLTGAKKGAKKYLLELAKDDDL